jgi:hypothetical protein
MQDEFACSVGLNHVGMSSVVSAEGEAAGRSASGPGGANLA